MERVSIRYRAAETNEDSLELEFPSSPSSESLIFLVFSLLISIINAMCVDLLKGKRRSVSDNYIKGKDHCFYL